MSVRLKIEDSSEGLVATISQRDDTGKVIGTPSVLLVGSKEEAKQQAKTLARSITNLPNLDRSPERLIRSVWTENGS